MMTPLESDPQILGQLLLLQSVLSTAPDERRLGEQICYALTTIPPFSSCGIYINQTLMAQRTRTREPDWVPPWQAVADSGDRYEAFYLLPVATHTKTYGCLVLEPSDTGSAETYLPFIENTANLIALRLENKIQESELRQLNADLEDQVRQRTEALLESAKLFQITFESAAVGICITGVDGRFIMVNPAMGQMLGYSRESILKKKFSDFTHPGDMDLSLDTIKRLLDGESEKCHFEKRYVHASGNTVWALVGTFLVRDAKGHPQYFITHIEDITSRKNAEEALTKSQALQEKMLANIGDVIVIVGKDGTSRYKSPNVEKLFGWKPEELVGKPAWDPVHPEDLDGVKDFFVHLVSRPHAAGGREFRYRCRDGRYKWVAFTGRNLVDDPDICGILGHYHDISERKSGEQSLKDSEIRFRALHNASFGGIAIHDKGLILECNKGLSEITGYAYDELIGMDGLNLISDDTRETVVQNIASGYEKPYEASGVRKNGEIYPIRLEGRNIPFRGKPVRVVEFRDISESKAADQEKKVLEAQLRQAQKMEAIGRLAGGVAHDFNNMLSVIIGQAEMALDGMDPDHSLHTCLGEIKKAGERSADLTRQLLGFARKQTMSPEVLDINRTVSGMTRMLKRLIGEDIALAWFPGDAVWPVKMDPGQIDQILANLCVNARDAIHGVGKITIETGNVVFDQVYCEDHPGFLPGEYVSIGVSDNGCGMDAETAEHIFEPFFTTKASGKGTGLGLAMVYGVVKQNNGFINVYTEPGQGTTIKIYLLRHQEGAGRQPAEGPDRQISQGSETILLVEDEPAILTMTTMMLERLGYRVVGATTPGEAVRLAREYEGEIHLLLTDVVMPEMNGRELAKIILALYPRLKRLFMSGYTANVIAHHGVLEEGVNFLQKPFSRQSLADRVREVLDGNGK